MNADSGFRARFRWLWWSVLSWMGLVPDTRDRPGDDDQFGQWPPVRAEAVNLQARQDNDERRWDP